MRLLYILLTSISSGTSCTYTWSSTTYELHVYETKSAPSRACMPGPAIATTHVNDPPSKIHAYHHDPHAPQSLSNISSTTC